MLQTSNTNQNYMTKVTAMLTEILINDLGYQPTLQIIFPEYNNQIDLEHKCKVSMMKFLLKSLIEIILKFCLS